MAIDPNELRSVMGQFASGVTIITTHDGDGRDFGLTASAFCSVSLTPPLILVCIDKRAESYPAFARSRAFTVNILARGQEEMSRRFAKSGGDKFAGLDIARGATACGRIAGSLAHLDCKVAAEHDAGDHTIYVGEVEAIEVAEGDPLLYFRGAYQRLAQP
jgi:3-hydroxy-9,10-secoandrosta-1,3,5(10)-triene-9,17-dione monooxygenase reductase component